MNAMVLDNIPYLLTYIRHESHELLLRTCCNKSYEKLNKIPFCLYFTLCNKLFFDTFENLLNSNDRYTEFIQEPNILKLN